MSTESATQSARIQENINDDECQENIPPANTSTTSKIKAQVEDVTGASSTQTHEDNKSLSDSCTFSTPAPTSNSGFKTKSQISGFQSALTPILKCLNIGSKRQSPSKHGNNPTLTVPRFSFGQKSSRDSVQHPNSDVFSHNSGLSVGGRKGPGCCLEAELFPDITLLDVTCDSTMQMTKNDSFLPDGAPATPVTPRCVNSTLPALQPSESKIVDSLPEEDGATNLTNSLCKNNTETSLIVNHSSSAGKERCTSVQDSTLESHSMKTATSLESVNTTSDLQNNTSDHTVSFKQTETSLSETHQSTKVRPCPNVSNTVASAKVGNPEVLPSEQETCVKKSSNIDPNTQLGCDITLLDITHDSEPSPGILSTDISRHDCLKDRQIVAVSRQRVIQKEGLSVAQSDVIKTSLDATRDITMGSVLESSSSASDGSRQNMEKAHYVNVTHDISMSCDTSARSAQTSYDMECSTSTKKAEMHVEPTADTMKANKEEQLTNHGTELTSTVSPSPQTAGSLNTSSAAVQPSNLSASTGLNMTVPISGPQNRTHDLSTSNVNGEGADQTTSVTIHQDNTNSKESSVCVQNATFDRHSVQKSSDNTVGDAGGTFQIQNNTFDCKPPSKQDGTISLSETSHQNALDKPATPKVCNLTTDLKEENSEGLPPTAEPNANRNSTFEGHPVLQGASSAGGYDAKDHSDLPASEGLCNTSRHEAMDIENNKASTFNLDDTLDLREDSLITSTPMTRCKIFHLTSESEEGKLSGPQKEQHGDGPCQPAVQVPSSVPSGVPSNIICDRKTFLTQPAVKSLWPPSTAASRLLKFKPASTLPGRFDPLSLTSGLPMTRQRTQAKALKDTSASDASQGSIGMSSSYNLRATTTASRKPSSGLQKPQRSGIPTGIQRAAPGLRPPLAKLNVASSLSAEKLCGPTAANPVIKPSQAKRHALTRGDNVPVPKKKKMDLPVSSDNVEASTSDTKGTKNLKQPASSRKAVPAKTQRDDAAVAKSTVQTTTSCDAAKGARALKPPASTQRAVPEKQAQAHEAAVSANTVESSTSCDAAKPLTTTSQGAPEAKQQAHACAKCAELEEQLRIKSEEIHRLKEAMVNSRGTQEEER